MSRPGDWALEVTLYHHVALAFFVVLSAFTPACAEAQQPQRVPQSTISFQLTLGVNHARGAGEFIGSSETALGGDALLSVRLRPVASGHLLIGAGAGSRITPRITTSECIIDSRNECMDRFPTFRLAAIHFGWETNTANTRFLAGPAFVDSGVADPSLGWQIRFEGARRISPRIAFVLGVRATVVPNHRDDMFGIFSGGVGFRVN